MRKMRLKEFWRRYKKNKAALIGLIIFIIMLFFAIFPYISPYDPREFNTESTMILKPPDLKNPMGTDNFGRDILSRIIWGTRATLLVGIVVAAIAVGIGIIIGSLAGYIGGRVESLLMRFVDIFITIPTFFLALVITSLFSKGILNVILILGFLYWPEIARLVRAEFIATKELEYVEAARAAGMSAFYVIFKEILPNVIYSAIINASMQVAHAILSSTALSFLGLGDPNIIDWGWMLNDAFRYFRRAWWMAAFPGLFIAITVIAFNLIGDGLNDALNPRLKGG